MFRRIRRVHFVGIGGVGMSGLAEVLHASGYSVSGSDLAEGAATARLRTLGIRVETGHEAGQVGEPDVVVYSSAITGRNPELEEADRRRIPVISRGEMLAELMRMKCGVAIGGSHGKTTTTSHVSAVLQAGGLDPTTIVGGRLLSLGVNSKLGEGDVLVAEADESDGSFLRLIPTVVVVTNVDHEHLDHYHGFDGLKEAFLAFANRVPFYGLAVVCLDDPTVQSLLPEMRRRTRTYGLSAQAEVSAGPIDPDGLAMRFRARVEGRALGEVRLGLPGAHNVQNALAAICIGLEFDVPFDRIRGALEQFEGIARRFEVRGERDGVLVIDDYAHHPSEIGATLRAARGALDRRLVVAFQPHRYSRTRDVFEELARSFHDCDTLLITEIYPAGETKLPGVEARALVEAIEECGHRDVRLVSEREALVPEIERVTRPGDAVLFMGAGDIGRLAGEFLAGAEEGPGD